jgi:signal transduction histidine kinase
MKIWLFTIVLLVTPVVWAVGQSHTYTDAEAQGAWVRLQRQPLTETSFRATCDLIQDVGQTNIQLAYTWLAQYVPKIRKTGNRRWLHVLLINWGKGYESLSHFAEAEPIFRQARQNARPDPRLYGQAIVYTALLYLDWDKPDSVVRYVALGESVARSVNDRETLSFLYSFRASLDRQKGQPEAAWRDYTEAIRLAGNLPDKNALFTARFNRTAYLVPNPQQQVTAFDSLLALTDHPTLTRKPRFYERTTFYFRNPRPTVLYNLVQLNLLLADYDNAGRFATMVYDALVRPNPTAPQTPYLNAEFSFVKSQQGQFVQARALLDTSRRQFGVAESAIPYPTYFIAAGLLAEHNGQHTKAANYYRQALIKGATAFAFSRMPPELFYVRALLHTGQYAESERMLTKFERDIEANPYTTIGLYYYQELAELHKARNDLPGYSRAIDTYHAIRDSLTNLNQYRAVQQMMTRVQLRDKERQITQLNAENEARTTQLQRERFFYIAILILAGLVIGLLVLYLRNRQIRARQREALQQSQLEQLEKQLHIDLMESVIKAEESERLTISDQLHNEVNPLLAVVLLNVSSALETVPADAPTGPKLRRAQDVLASVTSAVRGISHRLTPQLIEQQGFKRAVEELAESVNLSEKVQIQPIVVGFDNPLPLSFLSDLYRIIQELVHNVIKHAQATEAAIEVIQHNRHVTIMVEDNGVGIPTDSLGDGQGLQTIRAKVALRHGQMDVQRKADGGTLIVIDNLELPRHTAEGVSPGPVSKIS